MNIHSFISSFKIKSGKGLFLILIITFAACELGVRIFFNDINEIEYSWYKSNLIKTVINQDVVKIKWKKENCSIDSYDYIPVGASNVDHIFQDTISYSIPTLSVSELYFLRDGLFSDITNKVVILYVGAKDFHRVIDTEAYRELAHLGYNNLDEVIGYLSENLDFPIFSAFFIKLRLHAYSKFYQLRVFLEHYLEFNFLDIPSDIIKAKTPHELPQRDQRINENIDRLKTLITYLLENKNKVAIFEAREKSNFNMIEFNQELDFVNRVNSQITKMTESFDSDQVFFGEYDIHKGFDQASFATSTHLHQQEGNLVHQRMLKVIRREFDPNLRKNGVDQCL